MDRDKDLWHFDMVSAYFPDAFKDFSMHKISLARGMFKNECK